MIVRFAPSWDDAAAETRALHVPIVVHRHGFSRNAWQTLRRTPGQRQA